MENNNRHGCRWTKCSEVLPEEGKYVNGRIISLNNRPKGVYYQRGYMRSIDGNDMYALDNVEWLDESIEPCATSSDAIKFAEWIRINAVSGNDGTWHYQESKNMYKCVNETELYQIYSQTPSPTGDRDCEELKKGLEEILEMSDSENYDLKIINNKAKKLLNL